MNPKPVRIAAVLVDRANYGRMKPVLERMRRRPEIDLKIICSGTMLLERFGRAREVVAEDGFEIAADVYFEIEGSVPNTMAKSVGLGIVEFSTVFMNLKPDFVLVMGDRYEAFGATVAAAYQNMCVIHIQGGEVSGSIDESTRHAITKLSHYHFPATKRAGRYLVEMGEDPATVFPLGCPSADVVAETDSDLPLDLLHYYGVGPHLDFDRRFILIVSHPVTTEYATAGEQMEALLRAVKVSGEQAVLLWPNIDAGSDGVSKAIRRFRENNPRAPLRAYKNFEPHHYITLLKNAACLVGNSSSFVRDASFIGTPVVLVGSRQDGREWCEAVHRVEPKEEEVLAAIKLHLANGRLPCSTLYGEAGVSDRIVDQILTLQPYVQKKLHYARRDGGGL